MAIYEIYQVYRARGSPGARIVANQPSQPRLPYQAPIKQVLNLLDPHGTYFGCKSGTQSGRSLSLCCTLPSHLQTVGLGLGCGVGGWVCGVGGFRGLGCVALGCGWVGVWRVGGFGVRERERWVGTETSVTLDPHGGFGLGCVGRVGLEQKLTLVPHGTASRRCI